MESFDVSYGGIYFSNKYGFIGKGKLFFEGDIVHVKGKKKWPGYLRFLSWIAIGFLPWFVFFNLSYNGAFRLMGIYEALKDIWCFPIAALIASSLGSTKQIFIKLDRLKKINRRNRRFTLLLQYDKNFCKFDFIAANIISANEIESFLKNREGHISEGKTIASSGQFENGFVGKDLNSELNRPKVSKFLIAVIIIIGLILLIAPIVFLSVNDAKKSETKPVIENKTSDSIRDADIPQMPLNSQHN